MLYFGYNFIRVATDRRGHSAHAGVTTAAAISVTDAHADTNGRVAETDGPRHRPVARSIH